MCKVVGFVSMGEMDELRRCTRCILPETFLGIWFNDEHALFASVTLYAISRVSRKLNNKVK